MKHTHLINALMLGITATLVAGCSDSGDSKNASNAIVRIDGSSTVYPVTEAVSEEFQREQKVRVTVGISGTGGGFKKFCRGEIDLTGASRPILEKEMQACQEAGIQYIELPVAYDALTVVMNPKNDFIKSMTVAELKTLWGPEAQQKINTWNQVNPAWPDREIKLFGAGADSGTFDYFTEAIIGKAKSSRGDYTASEDDNVLVQGVSQDVGAVGYFGYAYYEENQDKLKAVPIAASEGAAPVSPSPQTVMDGSYQPLSRPVFIYINAESAKNKPEVKAFVDYYLANAPELVAEVKYIPLPADDYAAVTEHWQSGKTGTGFGGHPEIGIKIKDLLERVK
ncbi:MAG TPA: PstS family phosphate ABC transporter substrate-binding protein [Methylophilaceae bacterium]|nr:PstS family phosphate ABC transporter substrate-binding protein [Methylophilaceae bacterium]